MPLGFLKRRKENRMNPSGFAHNAKRIHIGSTKLYFLLGFERSFSQILFFEN